MKKIFTLCLCFILLLGLMACGVEEKAAPEVEASAVQKEPEMIEAVDTIVNVKSARGTDIPTGIVIPELESGRNVPLVILAHGLWDNMDLNGYFYGGVQGGANSGIAEKLRELGIASVRMDFPGCGTSTESLEAYTNENMVADVESAYAYMLENYECIDPERVAILGFSYGGRIAALFVEEHPEVKTMVMNSPVAANGGDMWAQVFVACGQDYDVLYEEAKANGKAKLMMGEKEKYLSWDFFQQNETCKSCEALANYEGNALMLCGTEDAFLPVWNFEEIIANTDIDYLYIAGADHDFGFTGDNVRLTRTNMDIVVSYFYKHLAG